MDCKEAVKSVEESILLHKEWFLEAFDRHAREILPALAENNKRLDRNYRSSKATFYMITVHILLVIVYVIWMAGLAYQVSQFRHEHRELKQEVELLKQEVFTLTHRRE